MGKTSVIWQVFSQFLGVLNKTCFPQRRQRHALEQRTQRKYIGKQRMPDKE